MQALCGLQGIFDLFNCKTPEYIHDRKFLLKVFYDKILAHTGDSYNKK